MLARQLDRLGRREAVIVGDEGDLAAVDAALVVDHLEIGDLRLADHAVGRGRTAIGHGLAELDFGVAGAWSVLAGRVCQSAGEKEARRR